MGYGSVTEEIIDGYSIKIEITDRQVKLEANHGLLSQFLSSYSFNVNYFFFFFLDRVSIYGIRS